MQSQTQYFSNWNVNLYIQVGVRLRHLLASSRQFPLHSPRRHWHPHHRPDPHQRLPGGGLRQELRGQAGVGQEGGGGLLQEQGEASPHLRHQQQDSESERGSDSNRGYRCLNCDFDEKQCELQNKYWQIQSQRWDSFNFCRLPVVFLYSYVVHVH